MKESEKKKLKLKCTAWSACMIRCVIFVHGTSTTDRMQRTMPQKYKTWKSHFVCLCVRCYDDYDDYDDYDELRNLVSIWKRDKRVWNRMKESGNKKTRSLATCKNTRQILPCNLVSFTKVTDNPFTFSHNTSSSSSILLLKCLWFCPRLHLEYSLVYYSCFMLRVITYTFIHPLVRYTAVK